MNNFRIIALLFLLVNSTSFGQSPVDDYIEVMELKKHFLDTLVNKEVSKNWKLKSKSDSLIIIEGTRNNGLNNSLLFFVKSKESDVNFILLGNKISIHDADSSLMIEGIFEVHSDLIYNYGYCTIEGSLPKINSLVNYTETIKWLNDNSYCNFNSWVFVAAGDTITILYTLDGVYNFKHSVKKKRLITNYYKNLKELNKILD